MNAGWVAARAGGRRGWIELKHTFTTPNDLVTQLVFTAILLTVMLWTRTTTVPGTRFSLGTAMLARGVLGAWAVAGLLVAPILLRRVARRESGSSVAARREKALQHVG
jgi:hypothetical protein